MIRMVSVRHFISALIYFVLAAPLHAHEPTLVDRYLECLTAVWEQNATTEDVHNLGKLYAEQVTYSHPRVGIEMSGRDEVLGAMENFLGSSRLPRTSNVKTLTGTGVVVISFDLQLEVRSDNTWVPVERHQVVVLQTSDSVITSITDYW